MKKTILFFAMLLSSTSFAAPESFRYVSVRGEGEIKVKPDIVTVQLMAHSKAKDARTA